MKLVPLPLDGAFLLRHTRHEDERGWFMREFCVQALHEQGLHSDFPQGNLSSNVKIGTLRGMHFQAQPHEEVKIVRCIAGKIFDVIVDLRADSPRCGQWYGVELSAESGDAIYIPKGFAHGFQALSNNSVLHYRMGTNFAANAAQGFRYDDPTIGIKWPLPACAVSERDLNWPAVKLGELLDH